MIWNLLNHCSNDEYDQYEGEILVEYIAIPVSNRRRRSPRETCRFHWKNIETENEEKQTRFFLFQEKKPRTNTLHLPVRRLIVEILSKEG